MLSALRTVTGVMLSFAISVGAPIIAQAEPIEVGIEAFWRVTSYQNAPLPTGISLCSGIQCGGDASIWAIDTGSSETYSADNLAYLTVTNRGASMFDGALDLLALFTSFDHGSYGISIQDPLTQSGSFTAFLNGPGFADSHMCSIGAKDHTTYGGYITTPTYCSVQSPDFSEMEIGVVADLAPGQSLSLPATIDLSATFDIPEPPSAALLLVTATTVLSLRRRMAPRFDR